MLAFEYEPLVFSPKLETLNKEEDKGDIGGVGPSNTKIVEEEPEDLKGGKESPNKEVGGKTYASEQILEPEKSIV